MGYSHDFNTPKTFDPEGFKLFSHDVKIIVEAATKRGIRLAGGSGEGEAEISEVQVWFNGVGPDDNHETLCISRDYEPDPWEESVDGLYFQFCKTAHKPYDTVVVAVLLSLKFHFPEVRLGSDGDDSERSAGSNLYEAATGRKANTNAFA